MSSSSANLSQGLTIGENAALVPHHVFKPAHILLLLSFAYAWVVPNKSRSKALAERTAVENQIASYMWFNCAKDFQDEGIEYAHLKKVNIPT
jgi:hypothetical protein